MVFVWAIRLLRAQFFISSFSDGWFSFQRFNLHWMDWKVVWRIQLTSLILIWNNSLIIWMFFYEQIVDYWFYWYLFFLSTLITVNDHWLERESIVISFILILAVKVLVLLWWLKIVLFSKRCHHHLIIINTWFCFLRNWVHKTFKIEVRLSMAVEFLCWRASSVLVKLWWLLWYIVLFFLIQSWCTFFWFLCIISILCYSSQWYRAVCFIIHFHDGWWPETEKLWWFTRVWNNARLIKFVTIVLAFVIFLLVYEKAVSYILDVRTWLNMNNSVFKIKYLNNAIFLVIYII